MLRIKTPDHREYKQNNKMAIESINKSNYNNNYDTKKNDLTPNFKQKENIINISLSSVNLTSTTENKVKNVIKQFSSNNISFNYIGEELKDIEESDYIIVRRLIKFNLNQEIKILYAYLINSGCYNNKPLSKYIQLLDYNYFVESYEMKKLLNPENFIIKFPFDFGALKKMKQDGELPLKGFKVLIHNNNTYDEEIGSNNKNNINLSHKYKEIFEISVKLLGGNIVDNIRLCDLCIINKIDSSNFIPPHVRTLNQNFIFDCLTSMKLMDITSVYYKPTDGKNKKIK